MLKSLKSRLEGETLVAKLFRGGAWLGAANGTEQGFRFLRNMILARILAPQDFGLMAIVLAMSSLFQVLTSMGLKEAVIQNPTAARNDFLNSAWWISLARGAGLYLIGFLAAPLVAEFYHDGQLVSLVRVAFLQILFQSALSPRAWLAVKELRYSRWVIIQHGGSVLGITSTLFFAWWLGGVWALVLGYVAEAVFRCFLSFLLCPFRPMFRLHREAASELLAFSRGMIGLPLLMLIYTESSTFVLGRLVSKEELGLYAMALTLARVPSALGGMLVDLLMPAFAQIQNHPDRVNRGISRVTHLIALVGIPSFVFASMWSDALLSMAYGQQYAVVSMVFVVLFANELLVTLNIPLAAAFIALGQPGRLRRFSVLRAVIVLVLVYPLAHFHGLVGAALATLLAMAAAFGFQLVGIRQLTNLDLKTYGDRWLRGFALSGLVFVVCLSFRACVPGSSLWHSLVCAVITLLVVGGTVLAARRSRRLKELLLPF